ncbi:hypothetical protein [Agrobacterium sp. NPDC089420]|uniref:hypothetical protein n=1 Tax=Agrobacterium sp. NPDC089420 TaxID=3363918 RepID=UPI00385127E6
MSASVSHPAKGRLRTAARTGACLLFAFACLAISTRADAQETYSRDANFPQLGGFNVENISWVTLSPAGDRLYMVQRGKPAISILTLDGRLVSSWSTDWLGEPHSLSFQKTAQGEIFAWVTDMAPPNTAGGAFGHCIKKFTPDGDYLGSIGVCGANSQGSGLDPVQFDKVTDVAFDGNGVMWVTDGDVGGLNNRVLSLDPDTGKVLQVWSAPGNKAGAGAGQFNLPHAITTDRCNRIFVADALNHRVQIFKQDGSFLQQLQCFGSLGVYGLALTGGEASSTRLFVSSSTTTFTGVGNVQIFPVSNDCTTATPIETGCQGAADLPISLPQGTSGSALHNIEVAAGGEAFFIAPLGGDLLPQKWLGDQSGK